MRLTVVLVAVATELVVIAIMAVIVRLVGGPAMGGKLTAVTVGDVSLRTIKTANESEDLWEITVSGIYNIYLTVEQINDLYLALQMPGGWHGRS